ncbi:MAG: polynucleotide adenylyltransferase PcnB [Comamonadaceae bacterium CG_4_9_14_0_8_um_filter_57_21]|nr:MAG: polynucleotide adenylyltransferase PcnB [Comamonadaceae bacterium CG_4_10_14_0_8_um_filter_57_29]PJC16193.1 MAG: polynucleotide adenylyltransferase PcnB [Comamonadaceae bacterium CG_4_9_14_0_8_um_filter_57_21]
MIKKFINKLLGKADTQAKPRFGKRMEIGPAEHGINPNLVDDHAKNVVRTLKNAGFEAYIVGGAVRDLMLGLAPKDFDVATNATPEQVKGLFRRAFIIGRRFRIVHVVYGRGREHEVIEVSTFRAYLDNVAAEQVAGNEKTSKSELAGMKHAVDSTGRVLRDNVWGPQEEDAVRRDFTINAMYYDPETQIVVDYHHGIKDSKNRVIRMIGDPAARYREDPVRIIRAIRFAAKLGGLGFKLEPKTATPLVKSKALLLEVPQSRMFDEMLKLLQTGHALASIDKLKELGMARGIYPLLDVVVERAESPFVKSALQDTDRRVGEGKPVAPSFLLACVLWADVRDGWAQRSKNQHAHPALMDAIEDVFNARIGDVSGRGKLAGDMREIWMMQPRFEKRVGSAPFGLAEQPRFRAAFDFMRLRAENGELDLVLSDWWEEFSLANDNLRNDMVDAVRMEQQQRPKLARAPRPPRAPSRDTAAGTATHTPDERFLDQTQPQAEGDRPEQGEGTSAPKKRRRRRRPAGQRPGEGADQGATQAPSDPQP